MKNLSSIKHLCLFTTLTVMFFSCQTPDKKLLILQDVQSSAPNNSLDLIYIADALEPNDFLSLDKVAEVHLYSKTNLKELFNVFGLKDNEEAKSFKQGITGLAGSRYYTKKEKLFGHKYIAILTDTFKISHNNLNDYDYVLIVRTYCQMPRSSVGKKAELTETWTIYNLSNDSAYSLNLQEVTLPVRNKEETFRTLFVQPIKEFITDDKISPEFKKSSINRNIIEEEINKVFQ